MDFKKIFPDTKMQKEARACPTSHPMFIDVLIFLLIFFVSYFFQIFTYLVAAALSIGITSSSNAATAVTLFSTAFIIIAVVIYCRRIERRSFASMGIIKKDSAKEYLVGLLIGALMFSLSAGICILCGGSKIALSNDFSSGDIIRPSVSLFVLGAGFAVQGMSEEILCRSYLLCTLSRRYSPLTAVLANSLMFTSLHVFNNGLSPIAIINLILFGIFASVYFLRRGSIWGIAAIHSAWNFVQGNIFGFNVSGTGGTTSLLSASLNDGLDWLHGGEFGPEGGIAVTVVLTVGIALMLLSKTKAEEL